MLTPTAKTDRTAPQTAAEALQFDPHQLIADMQRAVVDIWPGTTQRQLDQVAQQMRHLWGGDRPPYIARVDLRRRDDDIRRQHHQGERIPYLARKYQLTERQISRIVNPTTPAG